MDYKKLLIQQQSFNGTTYTNVGSVIDTQAVYHVVCQEFPFKYLPDSKELAKRDWFDEHGEDVYVPTDGLKMKAYDLEVTFLYVGNRANMGSDLKGFIKFIYGRNNGGAPMLAIYDQFTGIGKRGCYVTGVNNDLYVYDDANEHVVSKFKVKFRVTDPVTDITLS